MNFRTLLQASGLSEKDIDEVVQDAREATQLAHSVSGVVSGFLQTKMQVVKNDKAKKVLGIGALVAGKIHEGSGAMLRSRAEAPPPPRAPSGKKP